MSKRKLNELDSIVEDNVAEKRRRTEISIENLPDELLYKILVWTCFSSSVQLVCHKWHQIMTTRAYARLVCVQRWGQDIAPYNYDKSEDDAKKNILKECAIPLDGEGNVDWRRYYFIRSNYVEALQSFFPYKQRSELKKDRIKYALNFSNTKLYFNRLEVGLKAIKLFCDVGRIYLEQGTTEENVDHFFTSDRKITLSPIHNIESDSQERRNTTKGCKELLDLYNLAKLKDQDHIQEAVMKYIADLFSRASSQFQEEFFTIVLEEIVRNVDLFGTIMKQLFRNIEFVGDSSLCYCLIQTTEKLFKEGSIALKLRLCTMMVPVAWKRAYLENIFMLLKEYLAQDNSQVLRFVDWLTQCVRYDEDASHLAYPMLVNLLDSCTILPDEQYQQMGAVATVLLNYLDEKRAEIYTSTQLSHLIAMLYSIPSGNVRALFPRGESCIKILHLSLFGPKLEPHLPLLTSNFLFGDSMFFVRPYLEVLLEHYPVEAQKVVSERIDQGNKRVFSIMAQYFDLVEQCLGEKWSYYQSKIVDLLLGFFPENLKSLNVILPDNNSNQAQTDSSSGVTALTLPALPNDDQLFDYVQVLLTIAKSYLLPLTTQRQVLNLVLCSLRLGRETDAPQLPYLEKIDEETLSYYIALLTLSPPSMMPVKNIDDLALYLIEHHSDKVIDLIRPFAKTLHSYPVACAHLACYYGVKLLKESWFASESDVQMIQTNALYVLQYNLCESYEQQNVVKLLCLLLATSSLDPRIDKFTCHNHDWSIVHAAMNRVIVKEQLGEVLWQELSLLSSGSDVAGFDVLIPKFYKTMAD